MLRALWRRFEDWCDDQTRRELAARAREMEQPHPLTGLTAGEREHLRREGISVTVHPKTHS
jgi:hypothetical protein